MAKCFSVSALILVVAVNPCESVTVSGLPSWLEDAAKRSLSAVWSEIPDDGMTDREATLSIVAGRLFAGYDVEVRPALREPSAIFRAKNSPAKPTEVRINPPELRGMCELWFSRDISGLGGEISRIASEIPQEALTWADEELRKQAAVIISKRLPGWDFTQQIYLMPDSTVITLSFRPSSDMVLALKPSLYSRTIPVMFQSDLEAKMLTELSSLIGLPVKWAELHRKDIEEYSRTMLEDRHTVENMKANVSVSFKAGKISGITARVDSNTFRFSVWVSAYAGLEGRYPEAGAFFGFRPVWRIGDVNLAPEIYTELIFTLDNFGLSQRFGERFELVQNFWAGIEYMTPDDEFFVRLEYIPVKIRRPYARWRWSLNSSKQEAGLGYRFDEHISAEIYYDGNIGLRGIWNL